MLNKKFVTALIVSSLAGSFGANASASMNSNFSSKEVARSTAQEDKKILKRSIDKVSEKIPKKAKKNLKEKDKEILARISSYAIIETMSLMIAEEDSPWSKAFKKGKLEIQRIVPIFDLEENLTETMIVFNEGYISIDATTNTVNRYSYGQVDLSYFDQSDKVYINNFEYFAVDEDGNIEDGRNKGKNISEIKEQKNTKKDNSQRENKWGSLSNEEIDSLLEGFLTGANEGDSKENFITDPQLWLLRWYPNNNSNITNLSVTLYDSYSKSLPEINQNASNWPYAGDCAVISTLELFRYFWGITDSTVQKKAYNAMINSEYFQKPDNGVYWYNNDDLFKIGAEAIGKPTQSTSDDPAWRYMPSYSTFKSEIQSYGPGYLSFNDEPYGAHTVIVKGVAKYKTTFKDQYYIDRTYYDEFIRINDHWAITSSDAFMHVGSENATWYYQSIKPN